jgi:hypothetical protein
MNLFDLAQALLHGARAIPMDENTVSLLAMFVGVGGGVYITGYFSQLKAKRIKVERKPRDPRE